MMGYLTDLKNISADHTKVTGPMGCTSLERPLEDLSSDTSNDGAMYYKFT
jgi:hypothetical protein